MASDMVSSILAHPVAFVAESEVLTHLVLGISGGFALTVLMLMACGKGDAKLKSVEERVAEENRLQKQRTMQTTKGGNPVAEAMWLDRLVEELWPQISTFVKNLVDHTIGPAIANALPPGLNNSVYFTEAELGEATPHFGPLSVEGENDAIVMKLGISLASDMNVGMNAVGIYIGVAKLRLGGTMSVVFRPPMEKPPFFGGMEIFFANPMEVGLEFFGAARIAECPGIRNLVRSTIEDAISGVVVLPNRIAVDLNEDDDVDQLDLANPDPIGMLRVTLFSGHDLIASDMSLFGKRSSDPYVVMSLGATSMTSPVIKQNLNPVWGEAGKGITWEFLVHSAKQHLRVKVFDQDFASTDDLIGQADEVDVLELDLSDATKLPLSIEDGHKSAGHLTLTAKLLGITKDPKKTATEGPSTAVLIAKIRDVAGLENSTRFPYKVRVKVASAEASTTNSVPRPSKDVGQVVKDMCCRLHEHGYAHADIASVVGISEADVNQFVLCSEHSHQLKRAETRELRKAVNNAVSTRAATNPVFDQVVQLLVPSCEETAELHLLDKAGKEVGSATVDLRQAIKDSNLKIHGPFTLAPTKASLVASLRVVWLSPEVKQRNSDEEV